MMWHPNKYAELLAEKMKKHQVTAWLINTGWTGGGHGVGSRIRLKYTRAMVDAIHQGDFAKASFTRDAHFGFMIPDRCPGVPEALLLPRNTWEDKKEFDATQSKLIALFRENFKKFEAGVNTEIIAAGPVS